MGEDKDNKPKADDKPKAPKTLEVTVLRAVDKYKFRGRRITVPNDEYHKGLVRLGLLRVEKEG